MIRPNELNILVRQVGSMTTLTAKDAAAQLRKDGTPLPTHSTASASLLVRWLAWYRDAVARPASKEEKADWQKNSF